MTNTTTDLDAEATDQTDETTSTDEADNETVTDDEATGTAGDDDEQDETAHDDGANPSREAAKYRRKLRAAEAERDELGQVVDGLRRNLASTALADVLAKPEALWNIAGSKVGDYFDAAGNLDRDRLREDARTAVTEHGLGRYQRFQGTADSGVHGQMEQPRDALADAAGVISGKGNQN